MLVISGWMDLHLTRVEDRDVECNKANSQTSRPKIHTYKKTRSTIGTRNGPSQRTESSSKCSNGSNVRRIYALFLCSSTMLDISKSLTHWISYLTPKRHTPADRQVDFDDDDEDDEIEQVTAPRPAEEVHPLDSTVKDIFPRLSTH